MAGVTDAPFRELVWRYGAGYVVSEMLGARPDLWHTRKSVQRRQAVDGIHPHAVQIAGGDPATVAEAARRHVGDGADIIDINFGCPAKKVCRKAAGSQLLRDEPLVAAIVAATVAAVDVPVTVKMRTGWSPQERNGARVARIVEEEGAAAITVHGRTRACRFRGEAEFATVAAIKAAVAIPVFANGDIDSAERASRVLRQTGCDGVMIGRAALGRPWLLGQIAAGLPEPPVAEKLAVLDEHLQALHEFYGEPGVRIARKHVQWYLDALVELESADERRRLARSFNGLESEAAQRDFVAALQLRQAA